jgi:glycosyltransferase involved in cell wall biosynthesis
MIYKQIIFSIFLLLRISAYTSISLNMIVKDEAPVILRVLESVKPIIDYWVIVDTGSSDGTQDLIRSFMKDIPGELHERPWVNFGHNRNEALFLAKNKADYVLFIDADETLSFAPNFTLPNLDQDFYYIRIQYGGMTYTRTMLVNNHLDWKWEGVLHEYITSPEARTYSILPGVTNIVHTDGNRSKDEHKYEKDAHLLEEALIEEPNNERYRFYLAQSYKDAKKYELALRNYQKRVEMEGWAEETFWSMLQIALMREILNYSPEIIIDSYYKAYLYRNTRSEPLYRISALLRKENEFEAAYEIAKKGLLIKTPSDTLFVEKWIYDWGLLFEFSIAAYWSQKYSESLLASLLLLEKPNIPENIRTQVENNLVWIRSKL